MKIIVLSLLIFLPCYMQAQQVADSSYNPSISNPEYINGKGPVVFIDAGHHNFHTKDGRYFPFARILERDGYNVVSYNGVFGSKKLSEGKILVIANALNETNVRNWYKPVHSAFTKDEIKVVHDWVINGGSLFLIADHMPMAGAAKDLAAIFGFEFTDGFALDSTSAGGDLFSRINHTLTDNDITQGRNKSEFIQQVVSFTGQAFRIPQDATSILVLGENFVNILPDTAWVFDDSSVRQSAQGWSQGAYKQFGKGKIVVFGEAAMFTAQLAGPDRRKVGMNSDSAIENYQLLLNIIHWLDGEQK